MLGTCKSFFENLTATMVEPSGQRNIKSQALAQEGSLAASTAMVTHVDYLYPDTYRIKIEKLIPQVQQEKLKEAFGPEWIEVVTGMYKSIERETHDETIRKFSGLNAADGDKNE